MERAIIELFVRGLVFCLLTALTLVLLKRTAAAYRHLVCLLALCGLLALPLIPRLLPPLRLLPPRSSVSPEFATALLRGTLPVGKEVRTVKPHSLEIPRKPSVSESAAIPASPIKTPAYSTLPHAKTSSTRAVLLFLVWGVGAATLLLRLMVALFRLRRLKAQGRKAMCGSVPVLVSEQVKSPLTWGIRRSVILMPAALLSGDPAVCESALRHEQAHIARWDWAWNLLAEIVCALCWFQPGAWWLRRRLRVESERACDDRVLLSGIAAPDYAAHLLEILRSVRTNEVAPAMAQSGRMEERMKHILDTERPRGVQTKWLALAPPFGFALLSLAALRVAARPADAKPFASPDTALNNSGKTRMVSQPSSSAEPADKPAAKERASGGQANAGPAATAGDPAPKNRLENVTWGKPVDGLEPGLLPASTEIPNPRNVRRVSLNSRIDYRVLVRNTTDQEISFSLQCSNYGPTNSIPALIPNDDLRAALNSLRLPERFRAQSLLDEALVTPAYAVKLAPGEAVVVPEEFGLYIGDADKQSFPRIESIKAGMNWIVQPVTIHLLSDTEKGQYEKSSKHSLSIIDRSGKTVQRAGAAFGAQLEGKPLFARMQLEIGPNRDRTLKSQAQSVTALAFSPDSKRLVTGGTDGTANVWDAASGQRLLTLKSTTAAISSVLFTSNGKCIVTGYSDGTVRIWEAATGDKLRSLYGREGSVCALDVSSDGAILLGGYENGSVTIWNTATGQSLGTFKYDKRLLSAALSPDGKTIAAGYADSMVIVWDVQTQQPLDSKKISQSSGVTSVHFDTQGYLYTWDGEEIDDPKETHKGKIKITALTIWSVRPRRHISKITLALPPGAIHHEVAMSNFAMLFGLSDGRVVLNNMHDGPVTLEAHEGPVAAIAISPDGTLGATGGQRNGKGEAKIWDIEAHKPLKPQK